jgi:hypothetical protein
VRKRLKGYCTPGRFALSEACKWRESVLECASALALCYDSKISVNPKTQSRKEIIATKRHKNSQKILKDTFSWLFVPFCGHYLFVAIAL